MHASANLYAAWLGIAMGVLVGFILGINFHREQWLGGYQTLKRRLYRLAHIALFGLALINLGFYFTVSQLPSPGGIIVIASWGLIVGAVTMPICCVLMAHWPRLRSLFVIPVLSLFLASVLTLVEVVGI